MNAMMQLRDEVIENGIELARINMEVAYEAGDREKAREFFAEMTALIRRRSPERIVQMELERGLR